MSDTGLAAELRAAQERVAALERELSAVTGVVQKHQPGGSPPPGGIAELTAWVLAELAAGQVPALLTETDMVAFHRGRMAEHRKNAIASRKRAEAAESRLAALEAAAGRVAEVVEAGEWGGYSAPSSILLPADDTRPALAALRALLGGGGAT